MNRLLLAAFTALPALTMAAPALAADLPRPAYKAPAYVAPFNWTGFYAGINGGYGWGTSDWTGAALATGSFDITGGLVGGTIGYNLQTGAWVWSLEGDFDASWIKGSDTATCGSPGCETNNQWLATARGRIGYAWDQWMPFITGGAAFGAIKMTPGVPPTATDTQVGWTAGAGIEYAFAGPWSAKLEYLYVDLGKADCDAVTCGTPVDVTFKSSIVRIGVNYRFW